MSALYPRLLADDFAACFRFYRDVLPQLADASLARGDEAGGYASWDVGDDTALALFDRAQMAAASGADAATARTDGRSNNAVMLVVRVDDVDAAVDLCERRGATVMAPAADRPQWGPTMRVAHLRDPEGNLIEVQSY